MIRLPPRSTLLSLHDALPIYLRKRVTIGAAATIIPRIAVASDASVQFSVSDAGTAVYAANWTLADRKSTRLNSSHGYISYAVFCLKKKKKINSITSMQFMQYL